MGLFASKPTVGEIHNKLMPGEPCPQLAAVLENMLGFDYNYGITSTQVEGSAEDDTPIQITYLHQSHSVNVQYLSDPPNGVSFTDQTLTIGDLMSAFNAIAKGKTPKQTWATTLNILMTNGAPIFSDDGFRNLCDKFILGLRFAQESRVYPRRKPVPASLAYKSEILPLEVTETPTHYNICYGMLGSSAQLTLKQFTAGGLRKILSSITTDINKIDQADYEFYNRVLLSAYNNYIASTFRDMSTNTRVRFIDVDFPRGFTIFYTFGDSYVEYARTMESNDVGEWIKQLDETFTQTVKLMTPGYELNASEKELLASAHKDIKSQYNCTNTSH